MLRAAVALLCLGLSSPVGLADDTERRKEKRPTQFNLSFSGSGGLIRSVRPDVLAPAEAGIGFQYMNFDRDPGDTDFLYWSLHGAIGLPGRLELFFRVYSHVTSNSDNLDPLRFPVPPLELVVDTFPTLAVRTPPFFNFSQEAPFKNYWVPGVQAQPALAFPFSRSSGDRIVGLKFSGLSEAREQRFGLGFQGYVELPGERPSSTSLDWRDRIGTSGKPDFGLDVLFSKEFPRGEVLCNLGYRRIGDPNLGIRTQLINSGATRPEDFLVSGPIESRLDLKDQLRLVIGTSVAAFRLRNQQFWLLGEVFHERFIGSGTQVQRLVHPVDLTLGLQLNPRNSSWFSFGVAWQKYLNSGGTGGRQVSPFVSPGGASDVNFSLLSDPQIAQQVTSYLAARGLNFPTGNSRVLASNNPAFDSWRNIPSRPGTIDSRGHSAFILFMTVRRKLGRHR